MSFPRADQTKAVMRDKLRECESASRSRTAFHVSRVFLILIPAQGLRSRHSLAVDTVTDARPMEQRSFCSQTAQACTASNVHSSLHWRWKLHP